MLDFGHVLAMIFGLQVGAIVGFATAAVLAVGGRSDEKEGQR